MKWKKKALKKEYCFVHGLLQRQNVAKGQKRQVNLCVISQFSEVPLRNLFDQIRYN